MVVKKKTTVIQVLLLIAFIVSGVYIGIYFYNSKQSKDTYDELKQLVKKDVSADITDNYIPKRADNGMLEAYYDLYKRNNDMAGWLKIPDTSIDYPVVQYKDNDFYLHKNFDKKHQNSGIPFLDCQCTESSQNHIIYAHNMKDGTMFAGIMNYRDRSFYEAHKKILYDTLYDKGKYNVIACFSVNVGAKNEFKYYEYADTLDESRFNEYVKKMKENAVYDTGIDAVYGDELLTLSTCAYRTSNERFVVVAKKIKY